MEIPKEVIAQALIGDDAEGWMSSDLGRTILGMAEQEVLKAALEIPNVDVKDEKKIREIQNRIWRATQFPDWLRELMHNGREVLQAYKQQQE